jgi:DNA-binding CsgD family transcriptional regulator
MNAHVSLKLLEFPGLGEESVPGSKRDWVAEWFNQMPQAQILIDKDRKILAANPNAVQEFQRGDFLLNYEGVLQGATAKIDEAMRDGFCCPSKSVLTVWRSEKGEQLAAIKIERTERFLSLTLRRNVDDGNEASIRIGAAHDLTRAEERVLDLILHNDSADDIAESLGISVETARTHRKRIYAKIGVNGRPALMAYVARLFL